MGHLLSFEPGTPAWIELETVAGTTAASKFYCALFGWRVAARHRPIEDYVGYWIFLQDGGDIGGLSPGRSAIWSVYISVSDIDETTQAVAENGGSVLVWPLDVFDAGRLAVFTDPAGARFAAWEPAVDTGVDVMDVPNSFCWSELSCHDVGAAAQFYAAVFGWKARTASSAESAASSGFFLPGPGGGRRVAGLVELDERRSADVPPHWRIYFAVADTDAIVARAVELGGAVTVAPTDLPGIGRSATLSDPEGAAFAVLQR